ncbi:MAG: Txe/YoeB family addiction module toxin [Oscillospiraceae bacterium]|nr:Txe/YoeB family addiction module toxin [Oscillospiraceae bacterium]
MKVTFTENGFKQYLEWQTEDKKTLSKINNLIKSIVRDGFMDGIGKPEPLKGEKEFSRRIDDVNRLVYTGDEGRNLIITACKGHYK